MFRAWVEKQKGTRRAVGYVLLVVVGFAAFFYQEEISTWVKKEALPNLPGWLNQVVQYALLNPVVVFIFVFLIPPLVLIFSDLFALATRPILKVSGGEGTTTILLVVENRGGRDINECKVILENVVLIWNPDAIVRGMPKRMSERLLFNAVQFSWSQYSISDDEGRVHIPANHGKAEIILGQFDHNDKNRFSFGARPVKYFLDKGIVKFDVRLIGNYPTSPFSNKVYTGYFTIRWIDEHQVDFYKPENGRPPMSLIKEMAENTFTNRRPSQRQEIWSPPLWRKQLEKIQKWFNQTPPTQRQEIWSPPLWRKQLEKIQKWFNQTPPKR